MSASVLFIRKFEVITHGQFHGEHLHSKSVTLHIHSVQYSLLSFFMYCW